jgi:hypothetical protein
VTGSNGSFTVTDGHTYPDEGSDPLSVTITRTSDGVNITRAGTVAVAENDQLSGTGTTINATTNQLLNNVVVANFTDTDTATNPTDAASGFSATINWGDGTTTTGTVTGSNGSFAVARGHTYGDEGSDPLSVTVTRTEDNATLPLSGNVAVAENDHLSGTGTTLTENILFNNVTLASFTDTDLVTPAADLSAMSGAC